jgi:hypothetical protein
MALAAFERKILRKIFGPACTWVLETWRLRYNEELYSIYGTADVITHIKLRRLEWAGHVHRMQSSRIKKKTYGTENITWKTSGEASQVDRCCVPGREGAAGCQKMEAGS